MTVNKIQKAKQIMAIKATTAAIHVGTIITARKQNELTIENENDLTMLIATVSQDCCWDRGAQQMLTGLKDRHRTVQKRSANKSIHLHICMCI